VLGSCHVLTYYFSFGVWFCEQADGMVGFSLSLVIASFFIKDSEEVVFN
jgi:hypothetical protein